jgi:phosphate ABC transporter phosphate-binding protein
MRVLARTAAALAATVAVALALAPAAHADGPTVRGAGSTWVQIALSQWAADVKAFGLNVDYQGTGSTAGRQNYMYDLIDFAATEIPYQPDELDQFHRERGSNFRDFQYLPDVAGGTSFMYHVIDDSTGQRITNLRLSSELIAKIFTGGVAYWDDAALKAENAGVNLPHQPLTPVVRSDSSGTSAQLSLFLAHVAPSIWDPFARAKGCSDVCQNWPTDRPFVGQSLSSGVTNYVASTPNTINYVEAGYALAKGYPVAYVRNSSGNYALPTSPNVATALTHAHLHDDLTQDLGDVYTAPEPNAYPVSSYSYLIAPKSNMDAAKGEVLGKFIVYVVCEGQQKSALLGYSPLPPNLVQTAFDAVNRINGHAPTPDLSTQAGRDACNNPTFERSATEIGGAADGGGASGGGGASSPDGGSNLAGAGSGVVTSDGTAVGDSAGASCVAAAAATTPGASSGPLAAGGAAALPPGAQIITNSNGEEIVVSADGTPLPGPLAAQAAGIAYTRRKAALSSLEHVHPAASLPLVLSALHVPLLVFFPMLRRRRRGVA